MQWIQIEREGGNTVTMTTCATFACKIGVAPTAVGLDLNEGVITQRIVHVNCTSQVIVEEDQFLQFRYQSQLGRDAAGKRIAVQMNSAEVRQQSQLARNPAGKGIIREP